MIIVEHDNGIPGQRGYSEEPGTTIEDVERIKARYTQAGITIHSIDVIAQCGKVDEGMNEFFGNSYDPTTGTITAQRANMHPDCIPAVGDRFRIGPYLLVCTDVTDTLVYGQLAD